MSYKWRGFGVRRSRLTISKKLKGKKGTEIHRSKENVQRWINSLPECEGAMETGKSESPLRASLSAEIESSNVLPQRLWSAIKQKTSLQINSEFDSDKDSEISFNFTPSASSSAYKKGQTVVRSLAEHFERESVNASADSSPTCLLRHDSVVHKANKAFTPDTASAILKLQRYKWSHLPKSSTPTLECTEQINDNLEDFPALPHRVTSNKDYGRTIIDQTTQLTPHADTIDSVTKQTSVTDRVYAEAVLKMPPKNYQNQSHPKYTADNMNMHKVAEILNKLEAKVDLIYAGDNEEDSIPVDEKASLAKRLEIHRQKINNISGKASKAMSDRDIVEIMADIIIRQDQKITELADKVTDLQRRSMRKNIVITGLPVKEKENCKEIAKNFFKDKMKVEEPEIEVAHRLGKGKSKPMVVRMRSIGQKSKVFGNVGNLKGIKNEQKKHYRLDDQLPEKLAEKKRHLLYHLKDAKTRTQGRKVTAVYKRGELTIDQQPYQQQIFPPKPTDMLFAPLPIIKRSKELCIHEGETLIENASKFIGYTVEVETIQDVNAAYYKIRRLHGRAHHVMCSYRLTECVGPLNQDNIDDGEYGGSRNILQYLKSQEILNTAIFVVRYYGGAHLGPLRFQLITDAAKSSHEKMMNTSFENSERDPETAS